MELIQFKSINGRKFKNLKIVWAGLINEDDEEFNYDVDALDFTQEDRFHVLYEVPYKPDITWFRENFGTQLANSAVSWWNELPPNVQTKVTHRRLEYALKVYGANGNLRHVLPTSSNVNKLMRVLTDGLIEEKLVALVSFVRNLRKHVTLLKQKTIIVMVFLISSKARNFVTFLFHCLQTKSCLI